MDLTNYLIGLADKLDQEGKRKSAEAIDSLLIKTSSLDKLAQYVGVIGYVLKQERAMSNCVRRKRAKTDGSMQEVILSCLKEYQDGQNYQNDEWTSKYAAAINAKPQSFDKMHLIVLSTLGREMDIVSHLSNTQQVADILKEEQVNDEKIDLILSHIDTLGKILKKEAANASAPFKVAAAPQRSWWNRFLYPGKKDWWSPYGWGNSQRKGYGDDRDLEGEINHISQTVLQIASTSRLMHRNINRLKRDSRYLTQKLPSYPADVQSEIQNISKTIKELNPKDWDQTKSSLRTLVSLYKKTGRYDELLNKYVKITEDIVQAKQDMDMQIDDIYESMRSLRTREAMTGNRQIGYRNQGEVIAAEYNALSKVIDGIADNPLDFEGHNLALQQINRLNDSLTFKPGAPPGRVVEAPLHSKINDWIQKNQPQLDVEEEDEAGVTAEPATPGPTVTPAPSTGTSATPPPTAAVPTTIESIDQDEINELANKIHSSGFENTDQVVELLKILMAASAAKTGAKEFLTLLINKLGENTAAQPSTTVPQQAEAFETPVVTDTDTPDPGKSTSLPDADIDHTKIDAFRRSIGTPKTPDTASNQFISSIVKLADIIDPVNKEIADLIDQYLIDNYSDSIAFPKIPESSKLIKDM